MPRSRPLRSNCTDRGTDRGYSGHVPETAEEKRGEGEREREREREREKVAAQHRLRPPLACTENRVRGTHTTPTESHTLASLCAYICIYNDIYKPCFEPSYALDKHEDSTRTMTKKEKNKNTNPN